VAKVVDPPEVLERFEAELGLVRIVARQVSRSIGHVMELDDLMSFGREGLLEASRRYDPERGVPFRSYANYRVRGAILDGVRSSGRLPRRAHQRLSGLMAANRLNVGALEDVHVPAPPGLTPAHAEQALSDHLAAMATAVSMGLLATTARGEGGQVLAVSTIEDPEAAVGRAELLQRVRTAIGELPAEEAELVRRHYLEGDRFDEVAKQLGLSKSWASRLHTRALLRLTKRLRGISG
jgi:RNA polymerase sigma factor for flagellar operon FliA